MYGFGKLYAYKIVDMARNWKNVNPQGWYFLPTQHAVSYTHLDVYKRQDHLTHQKL